MVHINEIEANLFDMDSSEFTVWAATEMDSIPIMWLQIIDVEVAPSDLGRWTTNYGIRLQRDGITHKHMHLTTATRLFLEYFR